MFYHTVIDVCFWVETGHSSPLGEYVLRFPRIEFQTATRPNFAIPPIRDGSQDRAPLIAITDFHESALESHDHAESNAQT